MSSQFDKMRQDSSIQLQQVLVGGASAFAAASRTDDEHERTALLADVQQSHAVGGGAAAAVVAPRQRDSRGSTSHGRSFAGPGPAGASTSGSMPHHPAAAQAGLAGRARTLSMECQASSFTVSLPTTGDLHVRLEPPGTIPRASSGGGEDPTTGAGGSGRWGGHGTSAANRSGSVRQRRAAKDHRRASEEEDMDVMVREYLREEQEQAARVATRAGTLAGVLPDKQDLWRWFLAAWTAGLLAGSIYMAMERRSVLLGGLPAWRWLMLLGLIPPIWYLPVYIMFVVVVALESSTYKGSSHLIYHIMGVRKYVLAFARVLFGQIAFHFTVATRFASDSGGGSGSGSSAPLPPSGTQAVPLAPPPPHKQTTSVWYSSEEGTLMMLWSCVTLFCLANVVKALVARALAKHFHTKGYFERMEDSVKKEYYLMALSKPRPGQPGGLYYHPLSRKLGLHHLASILHPAVAAVSAVTSATRPVWPWRSSAAETDAAWVRDNTSAAAAASEANGWVMATPAAPAPPPAAAAATLATGADAFAADAATAPTGAAFSATNGWPGSGRMGGGSFIAGIAPDTPSHRLGRSSPQVMGMTAGPHGTYMASTAAATAQQRQQQWPKQSTWGHRLKAAYSSARAMHSATSAGDLLRLGRAQQRDGSSPWGTSGDPSVDDSGAEGVRQPGQRPGQYASVYWLEQHVRRRKLRVLTTLTDELGRAAEEADEGEGEREVSSTREAKRLAFYLFWNVLGQAHRAYLTPRDFELFFSDAADVKGAVGMFDQDSDGQITIRNMVDTVLRVYKERKKLALTLKDAKSVVAKLELVCGVVLHILMAFVYLAIFQVNVKDLWLTISSVVLAFVFVFGNSIRNIYESVIFLFVVHPFDVGDQLVLANGDIVQVEEIALLFTTFLRSDGRRMYYPNPKLISESTVNVSRSDYYGDAVTLLIDLSTPASVLDALDAKLKRLLAEHPREFTGEGGVVARSTDNSKLRVMIYFDWAHSCEELYHTMRWRSKVMTTMAEALTAAGVSYTLPPQKPWRGPLGAPATEVSGLRGGPSGSSGSGSGGKGGNGGKGGSGGGGRGGGGNSDGPMAGSVVPAGTSVGALLVAQQLGEFNTLTGPATAAHLLS